MTKIELINLVGDKIFWVRFRKADGTVREMSCRLHVTKGVKGTAPGQSKTLRANDEVVVVFDMGKAEFRSFRLDRLLELRCSVGPSKTGKGY